MGLFQTASSETEVLRPNRAEIEQLCLLHVVGDGCPKDELAGRLGLAPALCTALAAAIGPLVENGWVWDDGDAFMLTEAGDAWLEARLADYGLAR